jgi:hypothetical protein
VGAAAVAAVAVFSGGCERSVTVRGEASGPLFEQLSPGRTGIAFANHLPEAPEFNILNYLYYYNGGGVAVGDVDGDGLQDLYFSSNLESNRLYRNLGDYRFEDVTERAGVAGPPGWKTGVTMADVNGDRHPDIYVSAVNYLGQAGHNVLYLNRGDGTFEDRTRDSGLEQIGYSTQATFFDYDNDGDLDAYLLNHSTHNERSITPFQRGFAESPAADRLLRNDGGRFTDVTRDAGITDGAGAFGLGVVASDVNVDGCTDLYVANDFQENDYLYVNNCDGTFTESITRAMGHTSRFSMGVDAADINNDGLPEIFVADMQPEREEILKTSANAESPSLFELRLRAGYQPQYPRNTLQLNRGGLRFSDIGYLSGTFATDWSWAPLLADLDNDGLKDLFVTNGIYRRPNDLDYINYISNEAVQADLARGITRENLALLARMPQIPLPNHAFRNEGDLRFTDRAAEWGLADTPGFSNGAAWVDLNNSGALDLVVNAINAPAGIFRNRSRELNGRAFLRLQLRGWGGNTAGIGARVAIHAGGTTQWLEQQPTRGFQSSVDPRLHVGLGSATQVDSLEVVWPDRRMQVLHGVTANQELVLVQDSAGGTRAAKPRWERMDSAFRFTDVSARLGGPVRHEENTFLDYNREPLMPHLLSTEGPALVAGDVNGDGLDDLYVGGAKWQAGRLLVQQPTGSFTLVRQAAFDADSLSEDVDAVLIDVDGDRDPDLYVVSGGNEFWDDAPALRDRLYLNDGKGAFTSATDRLPAIHANGGCVAPGDFDGDGDPDLFVGARVVSREYGRTPHSRLLRNDGHGRFTDVTAAVAPDLASAGMVSSAVWLDVDGDQRLELVLAGEWMPLRLFRYGNGRLADSTAAAGLAGSAGWWNTLAVADINADGRPDLVAGNLGLNSYLRASEREPARLYVHDFFSTGSLKQVLTFYKRGVSYPVAGRDDLVKLMPPLRSRYPSYKSFGASTIEQIFPASELSGATVREVRTLASAVALNNGSGGFVLRPLPTEAQLSPLYAVVADDVNGDGAVDVIAAGNFHGAAPMFGRYDASHGVVLEGGPAGALRSITTARTGLVIDGEVRALARLRGAHGDRLLAVARNANTLQLWRLP